MRRADMHKAGSNEAELPLLTNNGSTYGATYI